jgi:hypothetical protein
LAAPLADRFRAAGVLAPVFFRAPAARFGRDVRFGPEAPFREAAAFRAPASFPAVRFATLPPTPRA